MWPVILAIVALSVAQADAMRTARADLQVIRQMQETAPPPEPRVILLPPSGVGRHTCVTSADG